MSDFPKPLPQLAGVNAYVPGEAPKNTGGVQAFRSAVRSCFATFASWQITSP